MSRLPESFAEKGQMRGDYPVFTISIRGWFPIVFEQTIDLYRVADECSAGHFYNPTTEPLIVEPTFRLCLRSVWCSKAN